MSKALYAGSFDPFTNGHMDILVKASKIFDEVTLLITSNSEKEKTFSTGYMYVAIAREVDEMGLKNVKVTMCNDTLVAEFAEKRKINYLVRGLRNYTDFAYEENIAKINKEINPNLETIYLRANNEVISSSMVRELFKYERDVSKYVGEYVLGVMKNEDNNY